MNERIQRNSTSESILRVRTILTHAWVFSMSFKLARARVDVIAIMFRLSKNAKNTLTDTATLPVEDSETHAVAML